ncbi:MAG: ROK family protein [Planctomycetes bacterium]|nr:ROK family protein [Planctomycetota bacterium]MBI3862737.1 ROK family protein [Planctomycetia bacterium]
MSLSQSRAPYFVGIDVGGTNIKAGVVDDDGRSLSHVSVSTEAARGPQIGLENIARAADMAIAESGLSRGAMRGVGLATPGTMDIPGGYLLDPPNLPGWINFPIRDLLKAKLQLPTVLQNDANAAAYGEFWAGGAKQARSLVFWTLGTGIGCGIILDHMIIEGAHSHGAECGHIIVEMTNGRLCGTGQYGTLEAYAGARAIVARCEEALAAGRKSSVSALLAKGEKLTPLMIGQAADAGDELCDELVMQTARYMGVGTTTLMHTIDPEMVLFGGAMTFGRTETPLGRRFLQEIRSEVKKRAFPIPAAKTVIEFAKLGGAAGYIGAAGCARLKFGNPQHAVD